MIEFFIYLISLSFILYTFFLMIRRTEYGILVLGSEFLPITLGLCIYPIFYRMDLVIPGLEGYSFLSRNGEPGIVTAFHVLFYIVFGCFGYLVATKRSYPKNGYLFRRLRSIVKSPNLSFRRLIIFGLAVYGTFFYLVGIEDALVNAAAARGGEFDSFGENAIYLFLKTLARISLYAVCFLPAILHQKGDRLWIFIYVVLVLIGYFNSISRSLLLYYIFIPFLMYSRMRFGFFSAIKILLIIFAGSLVLYYGKPFGMYMSAFLTGKTIELTPSRTEYGYLNAILINVEFTWFSVEAGVRNFFSNGIWIPDDLLYSPIGFIPSRFFEFIGLGQYYYGNVSAGLLCINAENFGINKCTIPPLMSGYSAYLMPILGGMIFGFIKFYTYGRLEMMWILAKKLNYQLTWIPYFIFIIASRLFSLIPNAIASTALVILLVSSIVFFRRFLIHIAGSSPGTNSC